VARAHAGEGKLLRVFVDESDRHGGRPAYAALVEALRDAGFTGATVFKGIEGFGVRRTIRSSRTVDYSTDLPVLIEVVEEEAKIRQFMPTLQSIVREGLVTVEHLRSIKLVEDATP
jgi:PII-like signaling protein